MTANPRPPRIRERDAAGVVDELLSPGLENPYPLYEWLRANAPVHFSERMGTHLLSRFDDCEHVLRNPSLFPAPEPAAFFAFAPEAARFDAFRILVTSIINTNPPAHTLLRRLVSKAFTPRRVEELKGDVTRIAAETVAAATADPVIDLHSAISVPVPLRVLARLLGLPEESDRRLAVLIPKVIEVVDPSADEPTLQAADDAMRSLRDELTDLVRRRRRDPQDDLVSALVTASERLNADELEAMLVALLTAGFETSATAIDIAVHTLLNHPAHRDEVREHDGALRFADEVLRWDPPSATSAGFRVAAEDVAFGEHTVPAGSPVRVLFGAANRDPAANPDPDRFDPHRKAPRSLAFGAGVHHCLGMNLAKMEIAAVLAAIVARMPGLRAAEPPVRRRSVPLRDFSSFRVRPS
ncbi:cytochrome P450 [Spirillospora sp. NBC_00431]